jgi:hypothetical protein
MTDDSQPAKSVPANEQVQSIPSDCGEWHAEPDSYVGNAVLHVDGYPPLDLNKPGEF